MPEKYLCAHERRRTRCRECGTGHCAHGHRRERCVQCGNGFCEHRKRRERCLKCGTGHCEHGRQRDGRCVDCVPLSVLMKKTGNCSACGVTSIGRNRQLGSGLCAQCDKSSALRTENIVWALLKDRLPPPSASDNVLLGGRLCPHEQRKRPDRLWVGVDRMVHLEIDEHSHEDRLVSCELSKMDASRNGVNAVDWCKPHIFLRFNPDACDRERISLGKRCDVLVERLVYYFTEALARLQLCPLLPNVEYLFYHSRGQKHIDAAVACENIHVLAAN